MRTQPVRTDRFGRELTTISLLLLLAGLSPPVAATEVGSSRKIGIGFAVGEPTGLSAKYFFSRTNALDLGFNLASVGRAHCWDERHQEWDYCSAGRQLGLHGDYLWQHDLVRGSAQLDWHVGVGGRFALWEVDDHDDEAALAVRVPVGLDLTFRQPAFLELFAEIAPCFYLFPFTEFDADAVVGARFYF